MFILVFVFCFAVNLNAAAFADSGKFGVIIGGQGKVPNIIEILKDLDVSWIRINNHLDGKGADISQFLEAGFNVVVTISNRDPKNLDTTYGSAEKFSHGGYPFKSKPAYQSRIKELLTPLVPYLKKGRRIMAQCENEISDASLNKKARYWRGTVDQYLTQLQAFYEAVRSVSPEIPVVLSSFPSEGLNIVMEPNSPRFRLANKLYTIMLTKGKYEVVDLHFYGCPEDIPAKVQWVKQHMPSDKRWISTENGGPDFRCQETPTPYEKDPKRYEGIQAKQVSQRLSACSDNGASVCLWFSLIDLGREASVFTHMGLLGIDGLEGELKDEFKEMINKERFGAKGAGELTPQQKGKFMKALRKKPAYEAFKSFVGKE